MVKKTYEDEEYHFSSEEGLENEETFEPVFTQPPPSSRSVMRRNLLVGLVLVLVILSIYKLMGMFFSPTKVKKTSVTATSTTIAPHDEAAKITSQPPAVSNQQPEMAVSSSQNAEVNREMSQKLSRVEIAVESAKSDVNSVNNSVNDLKSSLNDLTGKISDLNNTIANLTTQVQQQQQEIILLKPKPKPKIHIVRIHKPRPSGLYLEAIIAGRAWLKSANGTTLTVSDGSKIRGSGVVTTIDPQRGEVVLDSGEVIRFKSSER